MIDRHAAASTPVPTSLTQAPSLRARFGSAIYEGVLLFGVLFIFAYPYLALTHQIFPLPDLQRHLFQFYIFLVLGGYFVFFWCRSGQTLAMKTWHVRLVATGGQPPQPGRAALRYALAWLSFSAFLLGFLWALFDRDRQFLHDRILGTRLVTTREPPLH
ncbi:MAG: RDD family protein [Burkholderiaceae bacterium]|nr:MAG: RDD family protein [Burkholderiaceae bacterium]